MNPRKLPPPGDADEQVTALIAKLHETEQCLEEMTAGEVDAVAGGDGRTLLLRRAQDQLRYREATKQTAILNALPAHIALLDTRGLIISANEAWQGFTCADAIQGPGHKIGLNYLEICDSDVTSEGQKAAQGIRSVLAGGVKSFSIVYPCHSPTDQRWFLLTVTPLVDDHRNGAVVMHREVTAERKAEESLRDSELRFRQMAENIHDVFFLQNLDSSQIYYVSPAYEQIWGRTCESLYANPASWADSIHPDDLDLAFTKFTEGRHTGFDCEFRIVRPDGEIRWIHVRGFPILDDAGTTYRTAGVASDITQRKQAAEDLRRSESLKSAILEASLDCVITIDHEGKIVEFNPAAESTFGFTREQALGKTMVDLIVPPRLQDAHRRGFAHCLATGTGPALGKRIELEAIRADGTQFPIELTIAALRGTPTPMFTGFIRDITAPKRASGELRESARRFSDMLANVQMVSVMVDRDARISYCNDYLLQLTGYRRAEVIGRDWFERFIPEPSVVPRDNFAALLANQPEAWHRESEIVTRLGERRLIRWNNSVLWSGGGDVIGTASIGEDITEQKRAEIRIKRLNRVHAVLSGISAVIVRVRDRDELFRETCRIAVQSGQVPLALVAVVDPRDQLVKAVAWAGDECGFAQLTRRGVDTKGTGKAGLSAQAIEKCIPVVCNDIEAGGSTMRYANEALERGYRSAAALPLLVDGAAIGALVLYAAEAGFFDDEETKLLVELAGNISFALEHIDKQEKVRRLTRVHAMLSGINALIVRVHDRDELFREACRIAVESGAFRMAWIGVADKEASIVTPIAFAGDVRDFFEIAPMALIENKPGSLGFVGRAVRDVKSMISNDVENDPQRLMKKELKERGINSLAIIPLIVAREAIGVIALYSADVGFFDDEEVRLLQELAGNISLAIDHIGKQARLDYLAYYDVLTGLANRRLFLERVAPYMRSAASGGHKLALFLIDLERFKSINDSLGRTTGDALLRQVAEWLTRNMRDANLVARVGADHFAVVLPEVKQGGNVARLLDKAIEAFLEHPFRLNDSVLRIAAKVGVALFPDDGATAETLFTNAEAALKKAKASGDRCLFYTQKMTEKVSGTFTLENQLRQALDKEEFVLHYQPKISFASGKLTGAEALIRWNDPHTGLVPPGRFIPVLEETGLIHEVGRWALRKAIEDYLRWRAAGLAAMRIAVNVSPLQLRNRGFIAEIEQVIGVHAHAAAGLELEITESLIMEDVKHNIASLLAIRAMGVTIAIDDFGTGFSSLSYLAKLPVDTLKIDRTFVIDMTAAPQGLALVSTIITLAHSLKLKVVAEGVETEEQSRLLRSLSCDEMQGYLFSKPVPRDVFEARFLAPASALAVAIGSLA